MISDVLSEAAQEIRNYLHDETFAQIYTDELRARIEELVRDMDAIRVSLDTPPGGGA